MYTEEMVPVVLRYSGQAVLFWVAMEFLAQYFQDAVTYFPCILVQVFLTFYLQLLVRLLERNCPYYKNFYFIILLDNWLCLLAAYNTVDFC